MSSGLFALTLVAALGSASVEGAFFPFSTFAMAPRPPLMLAMFGTALWSVALVVVAASSLDEAYGPWLLAGAVV